MSIEILNEKLKQIATIKAENHIREFVHNIGKYQFSYLLKIVQGENKIPLTDCHSKEGLFENLNYGTFCNQDISTNFDEAKQELIDIYYNKELNSLLSSSQK